APHKIVLRDDKGQKVLDISLVSDRFGSIGPSVVWPDIGIGVPEKGGPYAFETEEKAHEVLQGRAFPVEIAYRERTVRKSEMRMAKTLNRAQLHPATEAGALRRGLLLGEDGLHVRGRRLPAGCALDLYLVESRHDWRPGDPFQPVRNSNRSEVVQRIGLKP